MFEKAEEGLSMLTRDIGDKKDPNWTSEDEK